MCHAHAVHGGPRGPWMLRMTGHGDHHRHSGPGFGPPWAAPGFRRRRMRRGDVRAALLVLLAEESRNGYGLIQEIERRSDGVWRPSPGSVYPALACSRTRASSAPRSSDGRQRLRGSPTRASAHLEENRERVRGAVGGLGARAARRARAAGARPAPRRGHAGRDPGRRRQDRAGGQGARRGAARAVPDPRR